MGVADVATDGALRYNADDCDELDVSAFAVDQLLSQNKCLVDQLDCGCGEDDDDQCSLAGTFIGDDDDELLSARTLVDVEVTDEGRPSLFKPRTDSSFSMRETSIMSTPSCTCGNSERRRTRLLSASEEYLEAHMRFGLSVRVVGIESAEMNSRFILRVEDIESKKHWEVRKNTKEMAQFYNQIRHICMEQAPLKKEMWGTFRGLRKLRLPKKFLHSRGALCYQRHVVYDSLLRHAAALISPAPMGPRRRQVVMLLQQFLNIPQYFESADREYCNCWFFPTRVNASQLVNEIFSAPSHPMQRQCNIFITNLIKKTHDTRRTRLYPRQAQAILRTITKKVTEVKKAILSDVSLLQQVGTSRHEMTENEFDDFVDEVRRAAAAFAQKAIMVELEDHVHESLHVLFGEEEERFILPKLRELQNKSQSFFGIPEHLQQWNDWEDACAELRRLNEFSLPMDKLKCILRASSAIFHACNASAKQKAVGADQCIVPAVSTDEFLQILFFVVAKSELSRPLLVLQMVRLACDQDDLTGEMGYYFANFEAAMKLVEDASIE